MKVFAAITKIVVRGRCNRFCAKGKCPHLCMFQNGLVGCTHFNEYLKRATRNEDGEIVRCQPCRDAESAQDAGPFLGKINETATERIGSW